MGRDTISQRIFSALAQDRRSIAADWRFHVVYMRVAIAHAYSLPDTGKLSALLRGLGARGEIAPFEGISGVYRVTLPYAGVLPTPDEAIVQEASPLAVFSHLTALAYHQLTDTIPRRIYVTSHHDTGQRHPLGTAPDDWTDIQRPARRRPSVVNGTKVVWFSTRRDWEFGTTVAHVEGYPIYVTDLERTLLDSLRFPDRSGGVLEVLRAWKRGAGEVALDTLVDYTERFHQRLLRQRVGYLLERLGLAHPTLNDWAAQGLRGSSAKLVAGADFSPRFSERWNLSLNVPESVISEFESR